MWECEQVGACKNGARWSSRRTGEEPGPGTSLLGTVGLQPGWGRRSSYTRACQTLMPAQVTSQCQSAPSNLAGLVGPRLDTSPALPVLLVPGLHAKAKEIGGRRGVWRAGWRGA